MATITQNITIDVARANVFDAVIGKQYDEDSRFLKCSITQEGEPLTIPSGSSIAINAKRPDGTMGSFAGTRGADGTAIVPISSWILEQNGMVNLSVSIVGSGGEKLTSCTFYLNVQEAEGEGFILVFTAPSSVATGTYYIPLGAVNYQFDLTTALATGDKIYFSSTYATGKTVDGSDGSTIETFTLTEGTSGTELVGSDVINFLASFMANIAELGNKADKVGESPDLVAGTAEQIIGEEFIDNKAPYSFRQTPGSGKRLAEEVVGATVAWNQLSNMADGTESAGGIDFVLANGRYKASGQATSTFNKTIENITIKSGHIYLMAASGQSYPVSTSGAASMQLYGANIIAITHPENSTVNARIGQATGAGSAALRVRFATGTTYDFDFYPQVFDLSAIFGDAVAQYLLILDTSIPGAGVAKFRELYRKDYYAHCEPTLQSVCVSEHREYGVNAWDEVVESGSINQTTGANEPDNTRIRTTNSIPIFPNTSYYCYLGATMTLGLRWYDSGMNYLSSGVAASSGALTIPANAAFLRFVCINSTTYNHNICINISNPLINGKYYPYSVNSYPLEAVELRGVLRLDSDNNIYADGDTYEGDGTVTRRMSLPVDLSTLTWTENRPEQWYATLPITSINNTPNIIADKYIGSTTKAYDNFPGFITVQGLGGARVWVTSPTSPTGNAIFELATPTTESAAPYPSLQHCSGGGTEEYVDYLVGQGTRDVSIPAGHNSKYYPDLTQRISDIPEPPSGDGTYTLKCTVSSGVRTFAWV